MTDMEKSEIILNGLCKYYKQPKEDVISKSRKQQYVWIRQLYCYFAKRETTRYPEAGYLSLAQIGSLINKDHSTVLHGIKEVNDRIGYNGKASEVYRVGGWITFWLKKGGVWDRVKQKRNVYHYRAMFHRSMKLKQLIQAI